MQWWCCKKTLFSWSMLKSSATALAQKSHNECYSLLKNWLDEHFMFRVALFCVADLFFGDLDLWCVEIR